MRARLPGLHTPVSFLTLDGALLALDLVTASSMSIRSRALALLALAVVPSSCGWVRLPRGGWSMLLRVADFGLDGAAMSARLLAQGVCATAMAGWGETHGAQYIRFVYANEPAPRLRSLGQRVRAALRLPPP